MTEATGWPASRRRLRADAVGIGLYAAAFGASFGAVSAASGLSTAQTCVLSLALFSGASQFALVGILGGGGPPASAVSAALLLGVRNAFYAVRISTLLPRSDVRGVRAAVTAQLVIDETTAMAVAQEDPRSQRYAFWVTGALLFVLWNAGTLAGALVGPALGDPQTLGLDAAAPAAFVALLWGRLGDPAARLVAATGGVLALALVPVAPAGLPVLAAALVPLLALVARRRLPGQAEP